jgi:hypothetical protein
MTLWAVKCSADPGVFTRGGAILVHDNRGELEFLFPGRETVDVSQSVLPKTRWRDHPDMASVRWPLRREDFR